MNRWKGFWRLAPRERRVVLRAGMMLSLTVVALRVLGFPRWRGRLEKYVANAPAAGGDAASRLALAREVTGLATKAERRGPLRPNCLERSLVLWWLLRRRGLPAELRIGARKENARFEAHAWVELEGEVLNDSETVHKHYARFDGPIASTESGSR
ncbi:MAG: lasso peptide biosynthesis B2 protein [Candidatus Acidiferrales bacterium]